MQIYRVETSCGLGPYNYYTSVGKYLREKHENSDRHPGPLGDGIPWCVLGFYHFGFISIEDLLHWFIDELEILKQHDYQVNIYECEEVEIGSKQIAFNKRESSIVGNIAL